MINALLELKTHNALPNNSLYSFNQLVTQRNRIIHSFQITDKDDEQKLATKDKKNNQYVITKEILLEFIKNKHIMHCLITPYILWMAGIVLYNLRT